MKVLEIKVKHWARHRCLSGETILISYILIITLDKAHWNLKFCCKKPLVSALEVVRPFGLSNSHFLDLLDFYSTYLTEEI